MKDMKTSSCTWAFWVSSLQFAVCRWLHSDLCGIPISLRFTLNNKENLRIFCPQSNNECIGIYITETFFCSFFIYFCLLKQIYFKFLLYYFFVCLFFFLLTILSVRMLLKISRLLWNAVCWSRQWLASRCARGLSLTLLTVFFKKQSQNQEHTMLFSVAGTWRRRKCTQMGEFSKNIQIACISSCSPGCFDFAKRISYLWITKKHKQGSSQRFLTAKNSWYSKKISINHLLLWNWSCVHNPRNDTEDNMYNLGFF